LQKRLLIQGSQSQSNLDSELCWLPTLPLYSPVLGSSFTLTRCLAPSSTYRARRQSAAVSQSHVLQSRVSTPAYQYWTASISLPIFYRTALHPFQSTGSATPTWAVDFRNITQTLFLLRCPLPVFVMPNHRVPLFAQVASSERPDRLRHESRRPSVQIAILFPVPLLAPTCRLTQKHEHLFLSREHSTLSLTTPLV
jgi:hypothetical protein